MANRTTRRSIWRELSARSTRRAQQPSSVDKPRLTSHEHVQIRFKITLRGGDRLRTSFKAFQRPRLSQSSFSAACSCSTSEGPTSLDRYTDAILHVFSNNLPKPSK